MRRPHQALQSSLRPLRPSPSHHPSPTSSPSQGNGGLAVGSPLASQGPTWKWPHSGAHLACSEPLHQRPLLSLHAPLAYNLSGLSTFCPSFSFRYKMFLVFLDAFFCCLSRHLTVLWFGVGRSDNMLNQKGPQTVILFIGGSSLLRALLL